MGEAKLYKYLDFNGGLMMLHYGNLQFTNATQLNDPFDCHPSLIDFSDVPKEACGGWTPEIIEELRRDPFRRTREEAWICSLSKIYDSILMWSNVMIGCSEVEVQYKDIVEKPDYFRDAKDFFHYQISTKAKAWEHEQEVRLFILNPSPAYMALLPGQNDDKDPIDWKEVRAFPEIGGECFESVYLGINMDVEEKSKIIRVASKYDGQETNKNNKGGDLRNHTFQLSQQFERTCCHDRQARFIADSCVLEIHRGTVQAAKG